MKTALLLAALLAQPHVAFAQRQEHGFWVGAGVGGGWNYLRGVSSGSGARTAGYVRLGRTLGPRLRVGVEVLGWRRDSDDDCWEPGCGLPGQPLRNEVYAAYDVGIAVAARPIRSVPIHLKAGGSFAFADAELDTGLGWTSRKRDGGVGVSLGVGGELRISPGLYLVPSVQVSAQEFGTPQSASLSRRLTGNGYVVASIGIEYFR